MSSRALHAVARFIHRIYPGKRPSESVERSPASPSERRTSQLSDEELKAALELRKKAAHSNGKLTELYSGLRQESVSYALCRDRPWLNCSQLRCRVSLAAETRNPHHL